MWTYILLCLCLSLAGVAGLQFFYMVYLDRLDKDRQNRIRELEKQNKLLTRRLKTIENVNFQQKQFIDSIIIEEENEITEEDLWADVIEER